jgi:hypothetical protein
MVNTFRGPVNDPGQGAAGSPLSRRGWLLLLTLQCAAAAGTVLRIDGFHFGELLRQ